jgi:hypothetical protein
MMPPSRAVTAIRFSNYSLPSVVPKTAPAWASRSPRSSLEAEGGTIDFGHGAEGGATFRITLLTSRDA